MTRVPPLSVCHPGPFAVERMGHATIAQDHQVADRVRCEQRRDGKAVAARVHADRAHAARRHPGGGGPGHGGALCSINTARASVPKWPPRRAAQLILTEMSMLSGCRCVQFLRVAASYW